MMVEGKSGRRVRGAGRHDRHDRWMLIAAIAIWGVVTGSMTMRADRSVTAESLPSTASHVSSAAPLPDHGADRLTAAEAHLQRVREAVAEQR